MRQQVAALLALVELPGYEQRKPSQLSGGQQQRVALARALINHPRVLLLDEPLGALDLKLRKQMQIELKRIQTEVGITFIYVTHDQEEAMTMSNRIAVMRAGRIEQLGPPEELYERPATEFVAGFLGVSNLLDGEVAGARWRARAPFGSMTERSFARRRRRSTAPPRFGSACGPRSSGWSICRTMRNPRGQTSTASMASCSTRATSGSARSTWWRRQDGRKLTIYAQNLETTGAHEALADGQAVRITWKPQHTFVIGRAERDAERDAERHAEGATDV